MSPRVFLPALEEKIVITTTSNGFLFGLSFTFSNLLKKNALVPSNIRTISLHDTLEAWSTAALPKLAFSAVRDTFFNERNVVV